LLSALAARLKAASCVLSPSSARKTMPSADLSRARRESRGGTRSEGAPLVGGGRGGLCVQTRVSA
jgi:hypothetical protein